MIFFVAVVFVQVSETVTSRRVAVFNIGWV